MNTRISIRPLNTVLPASDTKPSHEASRLYADYRQHVSGRLPEKPGGHQIARSEQFSHGHMSVVREEGNDTSSPLPSRSSECVSGPSVPEGSNPQERVFCIIAQWVIQLCKYVDK